MVYWVSTTTSGYAAEQGKKGRGRPRGSAATHMQPAAEGIIRGLGPEQKWIESLTNYLDFLKKQGRKPKLAVQDVDEFRLAAWYGCQRVLCKKGELSIERKKLLEKNGVNLEPNDKEQEWHTKLSNYLDFKAKHGREPKATLKNPDERMLAQWRNNLTRPNMIGQLSPEKRKLLEENGFNLAPKDNDKKWHAHLADYLEFEAKNGRPPSASTKDPNELRLAQWRANQTKNNGRGVPAERKKILEEKGLLAPRQRGRRMNQDHMADSE